MILPTNKFVVKFLTRITEDDRGCWQWGGMLDKTGNYPRWYAGDIEERWAHRIAYKLAVGSIPDGWTIDHTCHNLDADCPGGADCRHRRCVNPNHLEAVPSATNTRRAAARLPIIHGRSGFYRGCRCDVCRKAVNADMSARRTQRRKEFLAGDRDVPHGSTYSYSLGCKCDLCRPVALEKAEQYRRGKGVQPFKSAEHGTVSMYSRHKCRCEACRQCWSEYWKAYRARKRALTEVAS